MNAHTLLLLLPLLSAPTRLAKHGKGHDHDRGGSPIHIDVHLGGIGGHGDAHDDHGRHRGEGHHEHVRWWTDDDHVDELVVLETREVFVKRQEYYKHSHDSIEIILRPRERVVSVREREIVRGHWHSVVRLWRIRSLAEDAGDTATVVRVDAALGRADVKVKADLQAAVSLP